MTAQYRAYDDELMNINKLRYRKHLCDDNLYKFLNVLFELEDRGVVYQVCRNTKLDIMLMREKYKCKCFGPLIISKEVVEQNRLEEKLRKYNLEDFVLGR